MKFWKGKRQESDAKGLQAVAALREHITASVLAPEDAEAAADELSRLESQLAKQAPNLRLVRAHLASLRELLGDSSEGTALLDALDGVVRAEGATRGERSPPGPRAQVHTSGGTYVRDRVDVHGTFVGRDQNVIIGGNAQGVTILTGDGHTVTVPADQVGMAQLLDGYWRALARDCNRLPLALMDAEFARGEARHGLALAEVYTDLDVVEARDADEAGPGRGALRLAREGASERRPLLEALATENARRLVLLGAPGSGKSTFVDYVGHCLAAPATCERVPLPEALQDRLPMRLILRTLAPRIPENGPEGHAELLWDAWRTEIKSRLGGPAAERLFPELQTRLLRHGGLVLLDGLDEVPEGGERRRFLLEAIADFVGSLPDRVSVLLTGRPYVEADARSQLSDFQTLRLEPFNAAQVQRYVAQWYQAVRPVYGWDEVTAAQRAGRLQRALEARPHLADLASRPLLLSLMAMLHSGRGQLPEDRAELYEESVRLLLVRWQTTREVLGPDGEPIREPGVARALGVGEETLRRAVNQLAFDTHRRQRETTSGADADAPADIRAGEILEVLTPLVPDTLNPAVVLDYLQSRAGLILDQGAGVYTFPHRSFQEFLAACHLADQEKEFASRLRDLVWADLPWWREVFLLGVGKKRQGGLGDAVNVVNTLVPASFAETSAVTDTHWRAAVLAGEALLELKFSDKAAGRPDFEATLNRTRGWLRALLEGEQLPAVERVPAGDVLGRLGDPRPGVGLCPGVKPRLPDIHWVEVPAGAFLMGSGDHDEEAYPDERPQHPLELPGFRMARYPITNAQYRPFVEEGGYEEHVWWIEGWSWRQGATPDLSVIEDKDRRSQYAEWLAQRPAERRDRPFFWDEPPWDGPTRPVVGVCWYEALAYCRWLDARLREADPAGLPPRMTVGLPSEAQWEKAARGADGRRWPWDDKWLEGRANTREADLGGTSPVCLYPLGKSFRGAQDMAGNVWEWTRSHWGRGDPGEPDYRYPYCPDDGRERLEGPDWRVVRGGSWHSDRRNARCASRGRSPPGYFLNNLGFRVLLSLADADR